MSQPRPRTLTELQFDNSYARLPDAFHAKVAPTPLPAPYLVSFNNEAARLLDLDPAEAARPEFVEYFSGNRLLPGAEPLAMLYAGHQFGSYVPQLGDGRAILLGEVRDATGASWDVQLKGAGPTAYSRGFDGRAVLRSTIREYLCGEALHGLGIPTSRALCIIGSDAPVRREKIETAAVLTRLAPSHVRFGTFEVFYYRKHYERVRELADYVIARHFTELVDAADKYARFLHEVVNGTARLLAQWQAVGFTHGVMNTDNMAALGFTLDYGPFGFMDDYQADFIPNHSDSAGRYAYSQQPAIGLWNVSCFAQTLLELITREQAVGALDRYRPLFADSYARLMRAKLGWQADQPDDDELLAQLLALLEANRVDYTNFFRRLGSFDISLGATNDHVRDMFIAPQAFDAWATHYRERLLQELNGADMVTANIARRERMNLVNPKYVLRNYLAQNAINAAEERRDYSEIDNLLRLLRRPFDEQPDAERYAEPPPDWGKRLVVSCSS